MENERDWSALPSEMLHLISKKLPDLPDLVRFRVVCQRWRSATSVSDPPPQIPWFIRIELPSIYSEKNPNPQIKYLRFYSMISGAIPKFKVPVLGSQYKQFKGCAHQYVLAYDCDKGSLSLLSPLTGKEMSLPPLKLFWWELMCIRSLESGVFVAIYGFDQPGHIVLASCLVGDSTWVQQSYMKTKCCLTYYKGMFYVHDKDTRITEVIDATTGGIDHLIQPQEYTAAKSRNAEWIFDYFVESGGDLLGISGNGRHDNNPNEYCFEIHLLDEGNGNPQWVPMKSIGDRFLFLHNLSGVSYNASDFPGLKGNTIYYFRSARRGLYLALIVASYLVSFDIERGTAERLQCAADLDTWFLPGLA